MSITDVDKNQFLEEDLYNALRYLFEGAIAWDAWTQNKEKVAKGEASRMTFRHQGSLGMYTAFTEARALYDFFHKRKKPSGDKDNARADHFVTSWEANKSDVYKDYMADLRPANKHMFHLVYLRSGATGPTGELNEQVLNVAKDLRAVTEEFIKHIDDPVSRAFARTALEKALGEAQKAADHYGIADPLL